MQTPRNHLLVAASGPSVGVRLETALDHGDLQRRPRTAAWTPTLALLHDVLGRARLIRCASAPTRGTDPGCVLRVVALPESARSALLAAGATTRLGPAPRAEERWLRLVEEGATWARPPACAARWIGRCGDFVEKARVEVNDGRRASIVLRSPLDDTVVRLAIVARGADLPCGPDGTPVDARLLALETGVVEIRMARRGEELDLATRSRTNGPWATVWRGEVELPDRVEVAIERGRRDGSGLRSSA